jgi:hypothetical protein
MCKAHEAHGMGMGVKKLRASSILCPFEYKTTTSIAMPRATSCSNHTTNNTTNVNILSGNTFRNIRVNVNQGFQGGVRVGQSAVRSAVKPVRQAVSAVKNFLKF